MIKSAISGGVMDFSRPSGMSDLPSAGDLGDVAAQDRLLDTLATAQGQLLLWGAGFLFKRRWTNSKRELWTLHLWEPLPPVY